MPEAQDLEREYASPVLREVKLRSQRQSSLMMEGLKRPDNSPIPSICKQEPVEHMDSSSRSQSGQSGPSRVGGVTSSGGDTKSGRRAVTQAFVDGLEPRFSEHCEIGLCLDDKTLEQALTLFRDSKPLLVANIGTIGTGTVEETERLWNACVLYSVKNLSSGTAVGGEKLEGGATGFTLSQLLRVTKLSVVDFFKELPQFLVKVGPILKNLYGDNWEKRLQVKEVQANFVHLMVLFNHYKRVYQDFFFSPETLTNIVSRSLSRPKDANVVSVHMRFGWMLFLELRMHVLNRFSDLVTCTNGLLAVIVVLMFHMPPNLRKYSLEDPVKFAKRTTDGVNVVASLCSMYNASEEDVLRMVEKANSMISNLFKKTPKDFCLPQNADQIAGIKTDGLAYFEGLLGNRSIASNLRVLEKDYEEAYQSRGELDERMFINGDDSVIGTLPSDSPSVSGSKRKYDMMSSPVRFGAFSVGTSPSSPSSSPWSSPKKLAGSLGSSNGKIPPATPVSITMTTAKWLRTIISPLPAEPSLELQLFFRSCDRDISADVKNRVHVLLDSVFPTDGPRSWRDLPGTGVVDNVWAEQRKLEATKLYYRVLGAMCRSEAQRLQNNNLTSLLSNERFHRCMIACSAELVLATHKTVTMTFPAVLEPTGITAFDLSKVIEYFVRHEDTLPRELKRHLNSIEERLLESMAWEKGSSMYTSLIVAKPLLAAEINWLCLLAEPMPALDNLGSQHRSSPASLQRVPGGLKSEGLAGEISGPSLLLQRSSSPARNGGPPGSEQAGFMSPVKERPSAFSAFSSPLRNRLRAPLQSAFASPQRPSPVGGGETCAETVINVFFQKVLILAAVRIRNLCERVGQPQQLVERVYRVFQHALHNETGLFFNRHIDQLILCTIYGVCKVSKVNVTFRDIIHQYRMQPQCKPSVFRNVFINLPPLRRAGKAGGQETGDIIKFYNDIFVHATKLFLLQIGTAGTSTSPSNARGSEEGDPDGEAPGSPVPSSFPALPDMSPKKVSASHNVFVSPLRSIKVDSLMSPHTRSLYACVGESTHAYQSPSKDLTAINNRLNKRRLGRLDFGDAALVTDSMVANMLLPCNNIPTRRADSYMQRSLPDN